MLAFDIVVTKHLIVRRIKIFCIACWCNNVWQTKKEGWWQAWIIQWAKEAAAQGPEAPENFFCDLLLSSTQVNQFRYETERRRGIWAFWLLEYTQSKAPPFIAL
jgi:hypothetical protein